MGKTTKRPACAGRDDARSYSEGCQPSTLFPGTLALPLEETMRLVLNVIWLIFGGLWLALGYLLAALVCFLLIVTIPFGFAALRIASYALWPFGRTIIDKPGAGTGALIGNIIWLLLFGIWLAIGHLVSAVAMALTIIGIPLALANLKLIPVSLVPLGKEIVPVDQPIRAGSSPVYH
jgi:uncharacterized membrane protein YccF (DUF307 family)